MRVCLTDVIQLVLELLDDIVLNRLNLLQQIRNIIYNN